jgi:hypothetical protein
VRLSLVLCCVAILQRFLKDDGISIPCAYTSYLQPITAAKLWNDVKVREGCRLLAVIRVYGLRFRASPVEHTDSSTLA